MDELRRLGKQRAAELSCLCEVAVSSSGDAYIDVAMLK